MLHGSLKYVPNTLVKVSRFVRYVYLATLGLQT